MAVRCFWPPESVTPRSPTTVSKPSLNSLMACVRQASCAACSICSCVAPSRAMAMFSLSVLEKRNGSCSTTPTPRRSVCWSMSLTSTPPMVMRPASGSYRRASSSATVLLPLPVSPRMPSVLPPGTVKETSRSTGFSS